MTLMKAVTNAVMVPVTMPVIVTPAASYGEICCESGAFCPGGGNRCITFK